jgi:hypothetical protein
VFRRAFLGALPSVVLAGCLGAERGGDDDERGSSSPPEPTGPAEFLGDFMLSNDSESEKAVTVRVESNGQILLEETVTLLSGFQKRISNPIDTQGTYDITASLESGGSASYTWEITSCRNTEFLEFRVTEESELTVVERVETADPQTECPSETKTSRS